MGERDEGVEEREKERELVVLAEEVAVVMVGLRKREEERVVEGRESDWGRFRREWWW